MSTELAKKPLNPIIKWFAIAVAAGIAFFLLIQLVPYGRAHTNPTPIREPNWNSIQTRDLVVRACYDCHSDETVWPWYTNVAPFSWLAQHDVNEGRQYLNFSEWDHSQPYISQVVQVIENGSMPKSIYLPIHPTANLTPDEKSALIQGLKATFGM